MADIDARGVVTLHPRVRPDTICNGYYQTLLNTKYRSSRHYCCFREEDGRLTPHDVFNLNPRGTVGTIYNEDYQTLLHTESAPKPKAINPSTQ